MAAKASIHGCAKDFNACALVFFFPVDDNVVKKGIVMHPAKAKTIVVCAAFETSFGQGVAEGVLLYCQSHGKWEYRFAPNTPEGVSRLRYLTRFSGLDGIICEGWYAKLLLNLRQFRVPIIDVHGGFLPEFQCRVTCNNIEVGRIGARHLRERGLRHFAFYGISDLLYSRQRQEGFLAELAPTFEPPHVFTLDLPRPIRHDTAEERRHVAGFLRNAPKPLGIMCSHDFRALEVLCACRDLRLRVPEDVAIVGVGNDAITGKASYCPITSIDMSPVRTGVVAAMWIDRMCRGLSGPRKPVLIEPAGVIPRLSSDILNAGNPAVVDAIRFIRDHAHTSIKVQDVLREVPISRRALEENFQTLLGRTPSQEIFRCHIDRAKQLLGESNLPLKSIFEQCGFTSQSAFSTIFKKSAGITPSQYRVQMAGGP
jgi:LacI family transcriptional regulator